MHITSNKRAKFSRGPTASLFLGAANSHTLATSFFCSASSCACGCKVQKVRLNADSLENQSAQRPGQQSTLILYLASKLALAVSCEYD